MDVYGIDLGTTYSCVAQINPIDKLPEVVRNDVQMQTTPSVVYFDDIADPLVGQMAKNSMRQDPTHAVAFIKREMTNPKYHRIIGQNSINPVNISAMILKKVVDDANLLRCSNNQPPIKDVVITVPAYFNNDARVLTRQAGEIAGLNVLDLLNEPTAAALSYGMNDLNGKTFMIYDLGGGTFDVSIMRMSNNGLETLSTEGDHHLGGVDWDSIIVDYILTKIHSNETYTDIKDSRDGGELILRAEDCKQLLSVQEQAPIKFRYKGRINTEFVSRNVFEELTADLLERTINIVRMAISKSTAEIKHIDDIILVGGSSRMPMVKRRLQREFPNTNIRLDAYEPDLAVAKGAAIHAYNLANKPVAPKVKLVKDLSTRSYGIKCEDENTKVLKIQNLLLRTDPLVTTSTKYFQTSAEDQSSVDITIYENTSVKAEISLEEGMKKYSKILSWGYNVPKATPVTAHVDRGSDGIVHIVVECQNKEVRFDLKPEMALSDDEVDFQKRRLSHIQL